MLILCDFLIVVHIMNNSESLSVCFQDIVILSIKRFMWNYPPPSPSQNPKKKIDFFQSNLLINIYIFSYIQVFEFYKNDLTSCFSSPLGELFDHGLDSSSVWLMAISILSLFGTGPFTATKWEVFLLIIVVLFAFYVAHWEKYNTGVMFLPWAYDISQIVSTFLFAHLSSINFHAPLISVCPLQIYFCAPRNFCAGVINFAIFPKSAKYNPHKI